MKRGAPARKPRHREIETAPEEMNRACLAEKAAAKELEDAIGLDERAPEAMRGGGVVTSMCVILRKADGIGHLVRQLVDRRFDSDLLQKIHHMAVEIGHRLRLQRHASLFTATGAQNELVTDEVEFDPEDFATDRYRRRAQPACGDIERNLPSVIEPRRQHQPDFADDLRPEVERRGGFAPRGTGQIGPVIGLVQGRSPAQGP
jgi:hypothetical protein